jgi:hypothetical protein
MYTACVCTHKLTLCTLRVVKAQHCVDCRYDRPVASLYLPCIVYDDPRSMPETQRGDKEKEFSMIRSNRYRFININIFNVISF